MEALDDLVNSFLDDYLDRFSCHLFSSKKNKMISCQECIQRFHPDNPRIKSGRYHLCACDYCDKPQYFQELEQIKSEIQPIFKPRPVDKEIDHLKAGFLHLQNKLNEHLDKSKKRDRI